ncbi:MAG: helix-turn-helix domain-containing protein [Bdellovibrionales bacterium]|jgi:transcriptional regulator with XRE-family HTH domain|nr:helix-turn-helix domain-containing protein [Bdellovibrionales bacterium]
MKKQTKSWLDKKLRNLKFKQGFEQEIEKLSIAEQLLRLRLQSGLTQAQLAKKAGTTASAISRYENAEYDRYELRTLKRMADACGGNIRLVIEGPDDKSRVA